jgi:hypothetical protein
VAAARCEETNNKGLMLATTTCGQPLRLLQDCALAGTLVNAPASKRAQVLHLDPDLVVPDEACDGRHQGARPVSG